MHGATCRVGNVLHCDGSKVIVTVYILNIANITLRSLHVDEIGAVNRKTKGAFCFSASRSIDNFVSGNRAAHGVQAAFPAFHSLRLVHRESGKLYASLIHHTRSILVDWKDTVELGCSSDIDKGHIICASVRLCPLYTHRSSKGYQRHLLAA